MHHFIHYAPDIGFELFQLLHQRGLDKRRTSWVSEWFGEPSQAIKDIKLNPCNTGSALSASLNLQTFQEPLSMDDIGMRLGDDRKVGDHGETFHMAGMHMVWIFKWHISTKFFAPTLVGLFFGFGNPE